MRRDRSRVTGISEISPIVDNGDPVDVEALGQLIKGIVEPLAENQKISQIEATKRAEIAANIASKSLRYLFSVAFAMLGIAVTALFLGQIQLVEKIVFGVIAFLGGAAFVKAGSAR